MVVAPANQRTHRIVFANEKGGTGKSTTAVHVAVAMSYLGARVTMLDLDPRQVDRRRLDATFVGAGLKHDDTLHGAEPQATLVVPEGRTWVNFRRSKTVFGAEL